MSAAGPAGQHRRDIAPLPSFSEPIRDEWIDYNGHLSEAFYVLIFGHATDSVLEHVGLGPSYVSETSCSVYTVEGHVRYLREIGKDSLPTVTTRVVAVDTKKLRLCHEMTVEGTVVATEEILGVHVDQKRGRSAPIPEESRAMLEALLEPAPDYAGRAIGLGSKG